ncbi:MAG: hypothetical protein M1815_000615 [Lichina confinis]|nr:MAG: hypothetical protein M1815_000615 [Lichina confinis]
MGSIISREQHHLQMHRPSPTTVEFTVSTRKPRHAQTLSSRIVGALFVLLRVALAVALLLLIVDKWRRAHGGSLRPTPDALVVVADGTRELGCVLDQMISPVLELVLELELDLRHPVLQRQDTMPLRSHRLLPPDDLRKVIPRPMVQAVTDMPDTIAQDWGLLFFVSTRKNNDTSSTSSTYLSLTPSTRFIPTAQVQDIFIHEAFKGFEVRFYVVVVVEGEDEVVVVFPKLLPRLHILEQVWRGARACLYDSKET